MDDLISRQAAIEALQEKARKGMTLDEAIEHCEEVAEETECKNCAKEHRQLADWLKELRVYRKMYLEEHEDDCLRAESEGEQ